MIDFHELNEMMNRAAKGSVEFRQKNLCRVVRMIGGGTLAVVAAAVKEFENDVRDDVGADGEITSEATLESGYGIVAAVYVRCKEELCDSLFEKMRKLGWKIKS